MHKQPSTVERSWSKNKNGKISRACWSNAALLRIYSNIRGRKSVLVYFDSALLIFFFFQKSRLIFQAVAFCKCDGKDGEAAADAKGRLKERERQTLGALCLTASTQHC